MGIFQFSSEKVSESCNFFCVDASIYISIIVDTEWSRLIMCHIIFSGTCAGMLFLLPLQKNNKHVYSHWNYVRWDSRRISFA